MKIDEAITQYRNVMRWKKESCRVLTKYYCQQNNRQVFTDSTCTRLTDIAAIHYTEAMRLSCEDVFSLLLDMKEEQAISEQVERQVNNIINNNGEQR